MALKAVFFDVGETLVNEQEYWGRVAVVEGDPRLVKVTTVGDLEHVAGLLKVDEVDDR